MEAVEEMLNLILGMLGRQTFTQKQMIGWEVQIAVDQNTQLKNDTKAWGAYISPTPQKSAHLSDYQLIRLF